MSEQAVVIASFGTSVPEARASITAVEEALAAALADRFASVAVGRPLLADNNDIQRFARRLSQDHPAAGAATVFMGHGTEHFANAAYPALQTALNLLGRKDIYVGTVEGWPGLEDIVQQLEPCGPQTIDLLPLMLVAGDHARNAWLGTGSPGWKRRATRYPASSPAWANWPGCRRCTGNG